MNTKSILAASTSEVSGLPTFFASLSPLKRGIFHNNDKGSNIFAPTGNQSCGAHKGKTYCWPSNVQVTFEDKEVCNSKGFSFFAGGRLSFAAALAARVDSEGLFTTASLSAAADFATDFAFDQGFAGGMAFCVATTHTIRYNELLPLIPREPAFDESVKIYISPNPEYEDNIENYHTFFNAKKGGYELQVPTKIVQGGGLGTYWALAASSFQAGLAAWAEAQARAGLDFKIASLSGSATGAGASSAFLAVAHNSSSSGLSCVGGDLAYCNKPDKWLGSLFDNPAPVDSETVGTNEVIAIVEPNAKRGSKHAVENISVLEWLPKADSQLQSYETFISDFSLPENSKGWCSGISPPSPMCAPSYGTTSCCTTVPQSSLPNISVVKANSLKLLAKIEENKY